MSIIVKNRIIAMILAGGQGSRLGLLTKKIAKPAIPFGGKYRIIDFTLSNCSNSGIYTVGVLTQYKPLELNEHIGIGESWDLDRRNGGVRILPPYQEEMGGKWYNGTADAIYKNIEYINNYDPEYLLVLSGDHIYKMNYNNMLKFHKENNAEATIAVIKVPDKDASRFGIMNTNEDLSIYEFEEKPKNPKSNLASMGIYIFNWKTLKEFLEQDQKDENSSNDFGKNIIPKMLNQNKKMMAYPFEGYWKDVGTVESLWKANMDLLNKNNALDLYDENWKIYSKDQTRPSQYIGMNAEIQNSLIVEGCSVYGNVRNSVLFQGVKIGENSIIEDSVIMDDCVIGDNVIIKKAIIASKSVIKDNCKIGSGIDIYVVGSNKVID